MATIELVTGKLEATVRRTTIEESQSKEKKAKEDQQISMTQCYAKLPIGCRVFNKIQFQKFGSELMDTSNERLDSVPIWYLQLVHTYGPGDSFGELALQHNAPRAARVVAATDCHFATVSRGDYQAILAHFQHQILQQDSNFLSSLPYFAQMSKNQIKKIVAIATVTKVTKGQAVISEGCCNDDIYLVREGEFKGSVHYK